MEKQEKVVLTLDSYEHGIMIRALNELRNDMLEEQRDPGPVEDVLLKTIDAPAQKDHEKSQAEQAENHGRHPGQVVDAQTGNGGQPAGAGVFALIHRRGDAQGPGHQLSAQAQIYRAHYGRENTASGHGLAGGGAEKLPGDGRQALAYQKNADKDQRADINQGRAPEQGEHKRLHAFAAVKTEYERHGLFSSKGWPSPCVCTCGPRGRPGD